MPSQKRKDDDLVPKDKPEPAKRPKGSQPELPLPNPLPEWNPLLVDNDIERGKPKLPRSVNRLSPIKLFNLFFTEEQLQVIVKYTNANAIRIQEDNIKKNYRRTRSWHPVNKYDIMRYLAGVIHMGLHPEARIVDYWQSYKDSGVIHRIREFISKERQQ